MNVIKWIATIGFLTLLTGQMIQAADVAKGEKIYKQKCVQCHGEDGKGVVAEEGPRLAGQYDWYLEKQILEFKSGRRQNPKMLPFIRGLSGQDIKDVSSYLGQLK